MIRLALTMLLILAHALAASGQSVALPPEIKAKSGRPIFVSPIVDGDDLKWEIDPGLDDWIALLPPEVAKNFGASKIFYAEPGSYVVRAWTAKAIDGKAKLSDIAVLKIIVDGGKPIPPVPPTPPTPPKPPEPPPSPAPIPLAGLRVLIVYEQMDLQKYPSAQQNALYAEEVHKYLQLKCAVGSDGKTAEFRIWDKDTQASGDSQHWAEALKRPRTTMPWVIISNHPTGGFEGPLPANTTELVALLKKFGG